MQPVAARTGVAIRPLPLVGLVLDARHVNRGLRRGTLGAVIRTIAPQDFTTNLPATLADYRGTIDVEFTRGLGDTPWGPRETVLNAFDGRLLAFGADVRQA